MTSLPDFTRPEDKPLVHCRICHRDTNDREKHFKLHHESGGGFGNDCAEWNCQTYRNQHSPNTKT